MADAPTVFELIKKVDHLREIAARRLHDMNIERDALRARIAELERENAGLEAARKTLREDALLSWGNSDPHNDTPTLEQYEQWLRAEGFDKEADALFANPSAALARYRDEVLEEAAVEVGKMDLNPIPNDSHSRTISEAEDVIRAMKGGK